MITLDLVLCPFDFSDPSRRALEHAVALARRSRARLTALHVLPVYMPPTAGLTPTSAPGYPGLLTLDPGLRQRVGEELDAELAAARAQGIEATGELVEGDIVAEIVRHAQESRAGLVVMGTHGRGGFERLVLGSVAEKMLRKSPCPVLTVPPSAQGAAAPAGGYRRVLCGVDFAEHSLKALDLAFSIAHEEDAKLVLLHVLEHTGGTDVHVTVPAGERARAEAEGRLRALVPAGAERWCRPDVLVTAGRPHHEIARVAAELGSEVIVIGAHGRGLLERLFVGSTASHVVREAACPVLTVRG